MARISAAERSRIGVWPSTKQDFQLKSITRWPMPEESAWRDLPSKAPRDISREEWIAERMKHALKTLREVVDVDPEIRGGVPVLMGTRFSLAQVLAEIADGEDIGGISEDLDLVH